MACAGPTAKTARDDGDRRERLGAEVYAVGPAGYLALWGLAGVDFIVSPLVYGLVLLTASIFAYATGSS